MQKRQRCSLGGSTKFFWIGLSHETLVNYYRTTFAMMKHHNYSLTELEEMIPWEREIYVTLLLEWIEQENERIEQENRQLNKIKR